MYYRFPFTSSGGVSACTLIIRCVEVELLPLHQPLLLYSVVSEECTTAKYLVLRIRQKQTDRPMEEIKVQLSTTVAITVASDVWSNTKTAY